MDKTHNISLGGFSFIIEDKAYQELSKYLNDVRKSLGNNPDTNEIIYDVEQRMAELLKNQMKGRDVIVNQDVNYLIEVLGKPEQYVDEQLDETYVSEESFMGKSSKMADFFRNKKLFRDLEGKRVAGVFAGISHFFNVEKTWLRMAFLWVYLFAAYIDEIYLLVNFFPMFCMFWTMLYVILALIIPAARSTTEKLIMQGKEVNIDTISAIKETKNQKQLTLNRQGKKLLGVFAGLCLHYGWDITWTRILFVLTALLTIPFYEGIISFFLVISYLFLYMSMDKANNSFFTPTEESENIDENGYTGDSESRKMTQPRSVETNRSDFFGTIRSFFKGLFQFFLGILKIMAYFFVTIIIVVLLTLFFTFFLALLGFNVAFLGVMGIIVSMHDLLPFVFDAEWQSVVFYIALGMLLFVSLCVPILLLVQLFSPQGSVFSKKWIIANVLAFFIGILGISVVAGSVASDFKSYAFAVEKQIIESESDTVSIQPDIIELGYHSKFDIDLDQGRLLLPNFAIPRLHITEGKPYVEIRKKAYGKWHDEAKKNAEQVRLSLHIDNNVMFVPQYIELPKNTFYRNQSVRLNLYIPENKYVQINNVDDFIVSFNKKHYTLKKNVRYQITQEGLKKVE